VQYATRGFIRGAWTAVRKILAPAAIALAVKVIVGAAKQGRQQQPAGD